MRTLILAAAATAATLTATVASAQGWQSNRWNAQGWRTVGMKTVDGRDTDTIYLPGSSRQSMLRICAINAPLKMRDLDIYFANRGHQDPNTRTVIGAGTCTRAIDLRGNRRDIVSVRLKYEPIARSMRRPLVRVQVR